MQGEAKKLKPLPHAADVLSVKNITTKNYYNY